MNITILDFLTNMFGYGVGRSYLFPVLALLLFVSPLIIIKLGKKKFTLLNVIISLLIGLALAVGALYALYWWVIFLEGIPDSVIDTVFSKY